MKKRFLTKLLGVFGALAITVLLSPESHAIGIRPLRYEINVEAGQSSRGEVSVVNETEEDFFAEPSLSVFVANTEEGAPVYAQDDEFVEDILSWVDIPKEPIFVPAGQSVDVVYTVNVPDNAEGGGRYLLVGYKPVKNAENVPISVNVRAASVLIITVDGDVNPSGEVTRFSLPEPLLGDEPLRFQVFFKNTGNIHVKPSGWASLENLETGKKLEKVASYNDLYTGELIVSDELPINLRFGNVLPESSRIFRTEWMNNVANGKYRATLNIEYDKRANPITQIYDFELYDNLEVDDFDINITSSSADFELTVTNDGNVHQRLKGAIIVHNQFDFVLAEIPIPEDIDYILPGETKTIVFEWLDKEIPAGGYTASLDVRYGFSDQILEADVQFGELDRTKLFLIIALILAFLIVLYLLFRRRRANKNQANSNML